MPFLRHLSFIRQSLSSLRQSQICLPATSGNCTLLDTLLNLLALQVDAALDLSHTQNIGYVLKNHFARSQFLVVSRKQKSQSRHQKCSLYFICVLLPLAATLLIDSSPTILSACFQAPALQVKALTLLLHKSSKLLDFRLAAAGEPQGRPVQQRECHLQVSSFTIQSLLMQRN